MNHLTSVEIYIWNYLEENKAKIIQMTVAQIAESAQCQSFTLFEL